MNPIEKFSAYRSVRLLLEVGKGLYRETRVWIFLKFTIDSRYITLGRIRDGEERVALCQNRGHTISQLYVQALLAFDTLLTPHIDDDLPSDARIGGVAVSLDSEFQQNEIVTGYFADAAIFIKSQADLYGGDPFGDEYRVKDCVTEY